MPVLPLEILFEIVRQVTDSNELRSLALSSSLLLYCSQAALFHAISFGDSGGKSAPPIDGSHWKQRTLKFLCSLKESPHLASHVKCFTIFSGIGQYLPSEDSSIIEVLPLLTEIKSLNIRGGTKQRLIRQQSPFRESIASRFTNNLTHLRISDAFVYAMSTDFFTIFNSLRALYSLHLSMINITRRQPIDVILAAFDVPAPNGTRHSISRLTLGGCSEGFEEDLVLSLTSPSAPITLTSLEYLDITDDSLTEQIFFKLLDSQTNAHSLKVIRLSGHSNGLFDLWNYPPPTNHGNMARFVNLKEVTLFNVVINSGNTQWISRLLSPPTGLASHIETIWIPALARHREAETLEEGLGLNFWNQLDDILCDERSFPNLRSVVLLCGDMLSEPKDALEAESLIQTRISSLSLNKRPNLSVKFTYQSFQTRL